MLHDNDCAISLEATYINFTLLGMKLSDMAETEDDQALADELVVLGEWHKPEEPADV